MKTKQSALLLLILASLAFFSFRSVNRQNYRIVVGVAYTNLDCGGLTVKSAQGYDFKFSSSGGSISEMMESVKTNVANYYGIQKGDVVMKTGYRRNAVIISYSKKISGWSCSKVIYGVGFGDTMAAAEQDAIRGKESSNAHMIVKTISL